MPNSLTNEARKLLENLTPKQRQLVFKEFCVYCGEKKKDCKCHDYD